MAGPTATTPTPATTPAAPSRARQRVLNAATELFTQHGISGTSLQMIADHLGVTKAAVYHQYPAKDDIARALLEGLFVSLEQLVEHLESLPARQREAEGITGLVSMMVAQRQVMLALHRDPAMERLVREDPHLLAVRRRMEVMLDPPDAPHRRRLGWAVLGAGFSRALVDPRFADVDDEQMVADLVDLAHRILG